MRTRHLRTWLVLPAALALVLTACGGDEDGETITVGSFNFPESTILAEIYAQALEDAGLPVERELDIGARELIYPDLESGTIDLLPEYVGSALSVRFEGDPTSDVDESVTALREELEGVGLTALEPSDAENKNVFVVTQQFADDQGVSSVSDLADAGDLVIGGAPECEERSTCFAGLVDVYGLDNLSFRSIQEAPIRVESLANGEIDISLMFSTDPPLQDRDFVVLDDDQGIVASENIVPVVTQEVLDAHGDALTSVLDEISATLTTEDLIAMNGRAGQGDGAAEIAQAWLEDNGLIG